MGKRGMAVIFTIVCFILISVYVYRVRTKFNVDKQEDIIKAYQYEHNVLTYALSLLPDEDKNEVFFKSIRNKYPGFNENVNLRIALKYQEKEAKKKEPGPVAKKDNDTTMMKVLDNIIGGFI